MAHTYQRPYIASELPANLLLRKIGPKVLLPTLLTTWGIILMLQGTVENNFLSASAEEGSQALSHHSVDWSLQGSS